MRVITGKAKGRKLKMVPGDSTRPILDRIKENLFNIIGSAVQDSRWLDLFAGTGGVGIEALSRGASYCLFLDRDRVAVRTVEENLAITQLSDLAEIRRVDAFAFLKGKPGADRFEYIFIAPPQYKDMWRKALELIDQKPEWLYPDGVVIIQIDPKEYEELQLQNLELYDQRSYGKTMLCFYEWPGE